MTKHAIQARPKDYAKGYADKKDGERFSPPDFRTDAAAYEAYRAGYRDADIDTQRYYEGDA